MESGKKGQQVAEVGAKHILLKHTGSRNPNDSYRKRPVTRSFEEAMSGIQQVQRRLVAGEDFNAIARGAMQKPFEEAAFGLRIGEVSGPIVSDSGVHLILRYQ